MPDNYSFPRLDLPDDWTPDEDWCVTLHIPGSIKHVKQFVGWIERLTDTRAHERDPTHTGAAIVARRWADAINREPMKVLVCGEEEMTTARFRVKPGEPWVMQFSYDSGETWVDALMQPHWPVSTIATPSITSVSQAKDLSAQMIDQLWKAIGQAFKDVYDASGTQADAVNAAKAIIGAPAQTADATAKLGALYQSFIAEPDEMLDRVSDCAYTGAFDEMWTWMSEIEDWTQAFIDNVIAWSDGVAEYVNELAEFTRSIFTTGENWYAWTAAKSLENGMGGSGGGAGFGVGCTIGEYVHNGHTIQFRGPFYSSKVKTTNPDYLPAMLVPLVASEVVCGFLTEWTMSVPGQNESRNWATGIHTPPAGYTEIAPFAGMQSASAFLREISVHNGAIGGGINALELWTESGISMTDIEHNDTHTNNGYTGIVGMQHTPSVIIVGDTIGVQFDVALYVAVAID